MHGEAYPILHASGNRRFHVRRCRHYHLQAIHRDSESESALQENSVPNKVRILISNNHTVHKLRKVSPDPQGRELSRRRRSRSPGTLCM